MTEQEAIKEMIGASVMVLSNEKEFSSSMRVAMKALEEIQKYREIGTVEECRAAVEKQTAKTPTYEGDGYAPDGTFVWDDWLCPHCESRFEVDYDDYDYCPNCGQKIDWRERE